MGQKKVQTPGKTKSFLDLINPLPGDESAKPHIAEDDKSMESTKESGKLYQDQIYGTKVLTPLAVAIIDTPEFQRLAGLKQLGFASVSYRGAEHTRFAHSIGTYFLSRTIMRRLVQNHERLGLNHPGEHLSKSFRIVPRKSYPDDVKLPVIPVSYQSLWRGLTEVVSIAALLHDIGHVPFGHTLEDEFTGIYERHDKLAGPRLYEMLFNEQSELKKVFSDEINPRWIDGIQNEELCRLIYVILSWKEEVEPVRSFCHLVKDALKSLNSNKNQSNDNKLEKAIQRLENLQLWHKDFRKFKMFHPFMSDIIGNTICADLLDYLPRDRLNLGMEHREHSRLQRYLTIRPGTLYAPEEGLRVSIMVTRPGRGGQRRDVATAVLDIMRERYEMAERVYYHHKKAAISTMLAKMVELCTDESKPEDDENIYPAPWTPNEVHPAKSNPNMVHLIDASFIDYLGKIARIAPENENLRKNLYLGIKYSRKSIYRTLLVVDTDLVNLSHFPISHFTDKLRGITSKKRLELESILAKAADVENGDVLIYCPDSEMQSKEVNARLEIVENRVLPLRVQRESFTYHQDVKVLEQYYKDLWRTYVFVSPSIFGDPAKCRAIVDKFIELFKLPKVATYGKVRTHDFRLNEEVTVKRVLEPLYQFLHNQTSEGLPFVDTPSSIIALLLEKASRDNIYLNHIKSNTDPSQRITTFFQMVILEKRIKEPNLKKLVKQSLTNNIQLLKSEKKKPFKLAARSGDLETFAEYEKQLIDVAIEVQPEEGNSD